MFATIRTRKAVSRLALAIAAVAAVPVIAVSAHAADKKKQESASPKIMPSKAFIPTAQAMEKAIAAAKTRPDVQAAMAKVEASITAYNASTTSSARKAASAQIDASIAELNGLLTAEKSQLAATFTAAVTPEDKFFAGSYGVQLGQLSQDRSLMRDGYLAMLNSGKYPAADVPKLNDAIGSICYEIKDYVCAQTQLGAALGAGYDGPTTAIKLADSYFKSNQTQAGIDALWKVVTARKAAGTAVPSDWYGTALNAAFKAKLMPQAASISRAMVTDYPSAANWASAVNALRYLGNFEPQERMDLMRVMTRTGSYGDGNDYAELIQTADKLRLPAEQLAAVNAGLAAGKLQASDIFVSESKAMATKLVAEEKPTLGALEAKAKLPTATPISIAASADALLSYGEPAKAEALYAIALNKPGIDQQRVLTRMGIAQFDQGKFAEAQATFAKVTGLRQPIAQLWATLAAVRAKGG